MSKMITAFAVREEAHDKLDKLYAAAKKSGVECVAECREDPNSDKPYQVWDSPMTDSERSAGHIPGAVIHDDAMRRQPGLDKELVRSIVEETVRALTEK